MALLSTRLLKSHLHPVQQAGKNQLVPTRPWWFYSRNQSSCLRASPLCCHAYFLTMTGTLTSKKMEDRTGSLEPQFPLYHKKWKWEMIFGRFQHAGQCSKHSPGRDLVYLEHQGMSVTVLCTVQQGCVSTAAVQTDRKAQKQDRHF